MKRRSFLSHAAAGAALVHSVQGQAVAPLPAKGATPLVCTPPVAMAPRSDGFEIVWGVGRLCRGRLEVQDSQNHIRVFRMDAFGLTPQSDKVLRVCVRGLPAGKKHRYRAITEAVEDGETHTSDWREMTTLDPAGSETRWTVWNDTHLHDRTIQKLHEHTPTSDFLVWNGDICNDWTQESLLMPALLHPGGTDFTAQRPLLLAWGNHDVRGQYGYLFSQYTATPSGRPFYAFRSGPVAMVVLHTGEDKPDDHPSFKGRVACEPLREEQRRWLENYVLQESLLRDAPYRVVVCHIPLRWVDENIKSRGFDSFSLRSRELWHDALIKWGAQVVISGHMHQDALVPATEAFPYAQVTGGGPSEEKATWMEAHANAERLILRVRGLDGRLRQELKLKPIG